ncbi:MAG: hypothetical protein V4735_07965 [Pseudomonadota bacterium]
MTQNICPVCGYSHLYEPAYPEGGWPSDEICPCCGYQFGYHDAALEIPITFAQWREQWVAAGMMWWSKKGRQPPVGWNPRKQLENIGVFLNTH